MPITVKHSKTSAIPDAGDSTLVQPSDWNADHTLTGLGTMAEQNANAVAITGGTISGVTIPASNVTGTLGVANGGTGATTLTGYVKGAGTSAFTASSTIPNTDITGLGTASTKDAGAALGVATLDAGGKVPVSELPAAVLGALSYQGTWNASTNTPTLTSSTGTKGYYYVVSVAGNTNLDGITDWLVGDWAVYNGTVWQKVDNTETVTSVNGQTGAVVLTTTNIAEGTNLYYTDARARASVSAGTGISYVSGTGVITNSAPDQTVVLNAGTGISTSGTYPNFTITNTSPSLGGDVVGPASSTDNAIARFDTTTGKLLQNSVVTVGDTGAVSGVTTLTASTSVTTPIVQASNSGGLALKNSAGTTQISMGGGGGDNVSINVATNINGANAQIDISPTGTGHVHIKPTGTGSLEIAPTNAGTINNMVIGGTTPLAITGTTITATSFVGSGASLTNVVNSLAASTGISVSGSTGAVTITNTGVTSVTGTAPVVSSGGTTPAISMAKATTSVDGYLSATDFTTFNNKGNGTVTSVSGTGTVSGISLSGTVTSSGNLTLGGTLDLSSPPAIGGTAPNTVNGTVLNATNGIVVNSNTVSASYTIPSGSSAMSAGPMTVASGQTVTVSSGSRWVVL